MKPDPSKICFGLTEDLDRRSLSIFLNLAGDAKFADLFSQRLSSEEILGLTDQFMALIRKHLTEEEYHSLFLQDKKHHINH
ncbi:MAG: cytoplasmic protein [Desulforhopalus sp.]